MKTFNTILTGSALLISTLMSTASYAETLQECSDDYWARLTYCNNHYILQSPEWYACNGHAWDFFDLCVKINNIPGPVVPLPPEGW